MIPLTQIDALETGLMEATKPIDCGWTSRDGFNITGLKGEEIICREIMYIITFLLIDTNNTRNNRKLVVDQQDKEDHIDNKDN